MSCCRDVGLRTNNLRQDLLLAHLLSLLEPFISISPYKLRNFFETLYDELIYGIEFSSRSRSTKFLRKFVSIHAGFRGSQISG